jgi:hypothetical protein
MRCEFGAGSGWMEIRSVPMHRFHFKREERLYMLIQVKTSERDSLLHVIDSKEERMLKFQKSIRGESRFIPPCTNGSYRI